MAEHNRSEILFEQIMAKLEILLQRHNLSLSSIHGAENSFDETLPKSESLNSPEACCSNGNSVSDSVSNSEFNIDLDLCMGSDVVSDPALDEEQYSPSMTTLLPAQAEAPVDEPLEATEDAANEDLCGSIKNAISHSINFSQSLLISAPLLDATSIISFEPQPPDKFSVPPLPPPRKPLDQILPTKPSPSSASIDWKEIDPQQFPSSASKLCRMLTSILIDSGEIVPSMEVEAKLIESSDAAPSSVTAEAMLAHTGPYDPGPLDSPTLSKVRKSHDSFHLQRDVLTGTPSQFHNSVSLQMLHSISDAKFVTHVFLIPPSACHIVIPIISVGGFSNCGNTALDENTSIKSSFITHHVFVKRPHKTTFSWKHVLSRDMKTNIARLQSSSSEIVKLIFGSGIPICDTFESLPLRTYNLVYFVTQYTDTSGERRETCYGDLIGLAFGLTLVSPGLAKLVNNVLIGKHPMEPMIPNGAIINGCGYHGSRNSLISMTHVGVEGDPLFLLVYAGACFCFSMPFSDVFFLQGLVNVAQKLFAVGEAWWGVLILNDKILLYKCVKKFEEPKVFDAEREKQVLSPSSITLVKLPACSYWTDLDCSYGKMVAAQGVFHNNKKQNIGFAHTSDMDLALKSFDQMSDRDYISWIAKIASGSSNGYAIEVFEELCSFVTGVADGSSMEMLATPCGVLHCKPTFDCYVGVIHIYSIMGMVEVLLSIVDDGIGNALEVVMVGNLLKVVIVFKGMLMSSTEGAIGLAFSTHQLVVLVAIVKYPSNIFSRMLMGTDVVMTVTLGIWAQCSQINLVGSNFIVFPRHFKQWDPGGYALMHGKGSLYFGAIYLSPLNIILTSTLRTRLFLKGKVM